MKKTFLKETFRSIAANKLRFFSIIVIVALGFSFFVGIKSSAPQMRDNANNYFIDNNIADIRITSKLGFTENDYKNISSISKVKFAVKSKFVDTLLLSDNEAVVNSKGEKLSCRICTADFKKAGQFHVTSNTDNDYMNRLVLFEGRYPVSSNECVIDVNTQDLYPQLRLGKVINVCGDGTTLENELIVNEFTIVGTVKSPLYISDTYAETTVSTGTLSTFMYVMDSAFSLKRPNEIFIKAAGSDYLDKFSDEYNELVTGLTSSISSLSISDSDSTIIKNELSESLSDKGAEILKYDSESNEILQNSNKKSSDELLLLNKNKNSLTELNNKIEQDKNKYSTELQSISNSIKAAENDLKAYNSQRDSLFSDSDGYNELKSEYDKLYSKHLSDEKSLAESEKNKNNAAEDLASKKATVTSLTNEISQFKAKIENAEYEISNVESKLPELNISKNSLENQREHLYSQLASLKSNGGSQASIANANNEINNIDIQLRDLNTQINSLTTTKTNAENTIKECNSKIETANNKLPNANNAVQVSQKNYDTAENAYNSAKKSYDSDTAKLTELSNKMSAITTGKGNIEALNKNIDETNILISNLKIKYAVTLINSKVSENNYKNDITNANYEISIAEVNNKEASDGASFAKKQVNDRKQNLVGDLKHLSNLYENFDEIEWELTPLNKQEGFVSFLSAMENIRYTAYVFPAIFFIISMISAFVIMIRNVEDERIKVGIFKAVGYSDISIIGKYILYSTLAWLVGVVIGFPIGTNVLPRIIYSIYKTVFTIPDVRDVYNIWYIFGGLIISFVVILIATLITTLRIVRLNPSDLMIPTQREIKRRPIIEKIPAVWDKLSYGMVISVRTVMRNRKRILLGIFGIMCCTALILTSLGLLNSASAVTEKQYDDDGAFRFDCQITVDGDVDELYRQVVDDDRIEKAVTVFKQSVTVAYNNITSNGVNIVVPDDYESFNDFIDINNNLLSDNVIVITKGVAKKLKINAGDILTIVDSNGSKVNVTITDICNNYINDFIYMNSNTYKKIFNSRMDFSYLLCKAKDYIKQADIDTFTAEYSENENVLACTSTVNLAKGEKISTDRVGVLMIMFAICAALFSFILIFTISNINLSQRIREVANIKVIGFSDHESLIYVMRETNIITFIGVALGLVFGIILHILLVGFIQVDNVVYNGNISWWSYLITIGIIFIASLISALPMRIKIKNVNMAETLKEID